MSIFYLFFLSLVFFPRANRSVGYGTCQPRHSLILTRFFLLSLVLSPPPPLLPFNLSLRGRGEGQTEEALMIQGLNRREDTPSLSVLFFFFFCTAWSRAGILGHFLGGLLSRTQHTCAHTMLGGCVDHMVSQHHRHLFSFFFPLAIWDHLSCHGGGI
ncbi:uncharacterized protein P884DRAFT_8868 [Thermothelomyces heterothallicus CBS 202.75]|uniref:uncharacterized protein n=1 Tax=Thermothelomyces heterothallicus CBS 202.75 TaxID=1149848 RepID=UPI0037430BF9